MLNTKLGKAYGGQLFWKTWNWIDIEQLAKVWKFSDSMYNYLQRPNLVFASRLPAMTLKTCTLGHPKCLKMLTAYYGKTYKGQMVWQIWNPIETKQLAKVWKFSDSLLGGEKVEIWQFLLTIACHTSKKKGLACSIHLFQ